MADFQNITCKFASAKRALEIAAVGGHTVRLTGEDGTEENIQQLKDAFPTIGGDLALFMDDGADINVRVACETEADRHFHGGEESSQTVRERVEQARTVLARVTGLTADAVKLASDATEHGYSAADAERVGASVAALSGGGRDYVTVGRVDVAEALCYQRVRS